MAKPAPLTASSVSQASIGSFKRLRSIFATRPMLALLQAEQRLYESVSAAALIATRIALGVVFFWFGALKLLPFHVPIDQLAQRILVMITFHHVSAEILLHILGVWECTIGIGLLFGRFLRIAVGLLFLQMPGTFLPLILLRHETWIHFPWFPTFEGQYIIKNFVLIAAGVVVAATSRGGQIIVNPKLAKRAKRVELALEEHDLRTLEQDHGAVSD
jgi:uncharacterized membrane protein YphA (DoxX/SURF4 family)